MNIWLKIGKHSLSIGCVLILWAFLCVLPLRSLSLSETFPSWFQVPFSSDSKWVFILIGVSPISIMGFPLYILHQRYEKWDQAMLDRKISNEIEKYKRKK